MTANTAHKIWRAYQQSKSTVSYTRRICTTQDKNRLPRPVASQLLESVREYIPNKF